MKASFYDVKNHVKVELEVSGKRVISRKTKEGKANDRYVLEGKTADGRILVVFTKKETYDKA